MYLLRAAIATPGRISSGWGWLATCRSLGSPERRRLYSLPPMRLMITGAAGMLGQDVAAATEQAGHTAIAFSRAQLDITDVDAVAAAATGARPDAVINCAAYTNVDGAETEEELAAAINGAGAGVVARAAADADAWTIHVSSDYVFDGCKREAYLESDPVGPLSAYGRSKLAGELAVAAAAPESHTIVRSSWLFGAGGPCFPATILRLAGERDELSVVDDQVGCPTFTGHLADALVRLATSDRVPGVLHVAADGECSWYEFAREIVERAGHDCRVVPGKTADLGRPAPRPAFSVLRSERGTSAPVLPHWRAGLAEFISAKVPAR
jgi:dTDP-4-dehydrorhamnose reductase